MPKILCSQTIPTCSTAGYKVNHLPRQRLLPVDVKDRKKPQKCYSMQVAGKGISISSAPKIITTSPKQPRQTLRKEGSRDTHQRVSRTKLRAIQFWAKMWIQICAFRSQDLQQLNTPKTTIIITFPRLGLHCTRRPPLLNKFTQPALFLSFRRHKSRGATKLKVTRQT